MLWVIVVLLATLWIGFYAMTGLIYLLGAIAIVLYMGKLFAENRPL